MIRKPLTRSQAYGIVAATSFIMAFVVVFTQPWWATHLDITGFDRALVTVAAVQPFIFLSAITAVEADFQ